MAALWAVHPVLTESVTNIVGRADLLAAFGVLAGLLCYAGSVATGGRGALRWRLGLMAAAAIGVFSKESAVMVVAAVFLYDIAYCRSAPRRQRLWGYLAAALPVGAYLLVRSQVLSRLPVPYLAFTDNPLVGAGFWTARLTAVKVLGKYLWLLVWPQHLSCDYSYGQIPLFTWRLHNWEDGKAVLALAVCAGAVVAATICYRRSKPVFFFIAFFFVTLAPTANLAILIGTIMAERFLYLPSIGFAGCLVGAGWGAYRRLRPRWPAARTVAPAALALVCLAFGARTYARNGDWLDERSLWSSAVESSPNSYKAHQHLASVLAAPPAAGLDAARDQIERALTILKPLPDERNVPAVYATAGFCYRAMGDALGQNGGAVWYRKSLDVLLEGRRVDAAWDRAMALRNRQEGRTVALSGWAPLYLELGRTYRSLGEFPQALEALAHGYMVDSGGQLFEETAATYRAMGDPEQAAVALLSGIVMGSRDQVRLAAEVVNLYRETAPESCALNGRGSSAALNFQCPLVHSDLCSAGRNAAARYREMRRDRDAAATAASAVRSLGCPAEMFR
jgi:tetratricopeptide (TPR) repeat protein